MVNRLPAASVALEEEAEAAGAEHAKDARSAAEARVKSRGVVEGRLENGAPQNGGDDRAEGGATPHDAPPGPCRAGRKARGGKISPKAEPVGRQQDVGSKRMRVWGTQPRDMLAEDGREAQPLEALPPAADGESSSIGEFKRAVRAVRARGRPSGEGRGAFHNSTNLPRDDAPPPSTSPWLVAMHSLED